MGQRAFYTQLIDRADRLFAAHLAKLSAARNKGKGQVARAKTFDHLVSPTMSKASQKRAAARTKVPVREMLLSDLRKATGYSQKALATKLKMKQPSLSKLENARDMQDTTLQKLVTALGGELEIVCKFPKGDVRLVQFDQTFAAAG